MAMYWDKEQVAIEIIDDEGFVGGGKYPKGTLVCFVGASQVNDEDLVRCLRRLVVERGVDIEGDGERDEEEARREDLLWEAELQLARNLTGINDPSGFSGPAGVRDEEDWGEGGDEGDDPDAPDRELEGLFSHLGYLGCYPFNPAHLGARKVVIGNCREVNIG